MPRGFKTVCGYTNTANLKLKHLTKGGTEQYRVSWIHQGYMKERVYHTLAEALEYIQQIQAEFYPAEKTF